MSKVAQQESFSFDRSQHAEAQHRLIPLNLLTGQEYRLGDEPQLRYALEVDPKKQQTIGVVASFPPYARFSDGSAATFGENVTGYRFTASGCEILQDSRYTHLDSRTTHHEATAISVARSTLNNLEEAYRVYAEAQQQFGNQIPLEITRAYGIMQYSLDALQRQFPEFAQAPTFGNPTDSVRRAQRARQVSMTPTVRTDTSDMATRVMRSIDNGNGNNGRH